MAMTETLQEFFDSRGVAMHVDRQTAVIRGVKLLGLESRNGRSYLPDALAQAAPLYEDAKVNVNHPKGNPGGPRDYQDRIGTMRSVRVTAGEGLFADFHFNPKHALVEQLLWDAEHAPQNVGFSHNVEARTARRGDRVVVEAITRVQSVDLVADPATTRGLFESAAAGETASVSAPPAVRPMTLDELRRDHPALVGQVRKEAAAEIGRLREEIERLTAAELLHAKRQVARRLLREFHLPDPEADDAHARAVTSERFVESLLAAADETAMRELVQERARLVQTLLGAGGDRGGRQNGPQSRDQQLVGSATPSDAKSFVSAISG
jgi:hypothetical protein